MINSIQFNSILKAIGYTIWPAPDYPDRFHEVREMIEAWNENMQNNFKPGHIICLEKSMSTWTNMHTCPGFMFVPQKPWPFGNEYHTVCCGNTGIMFAMEIVEGKDAPRSRQYQEFDDLGGKTVGLLLRLSKSIWKSARIIILDSGFCVLKGIIELRKKGLYASALIKKCRFWPKYIRGEEIKTHFESLECGFADAWPGKLDNIPFHIYCTKEPDYVMFLMSLYGTLEPIGKVSMRNWLVQGTKRQKQVTYTEVIHNHYKFWHAVDNHNAKRHSPISLEVVWATKWWPNRVFAFILSVTEVNAMLAYKHFCKEEVDGMLGFRKLFAEVLVCNPY